MEANITLSPNRLNLESSMQLEPPFHGVQFAVLLLISKKEQTSSNHETDNLHKVSPEPGCYQPGFFIGKNAELYLSHWHHSIEIIDIKELIGLLISPA